MLALEPHLSRMQAVHHWPEETSVHDQNGLLKWVSILTCSDVWWRWRLKSKAMPCWFPGVGD